MERLKVITVFYVGSFLFLTVLALKIYSRLSELLSVFCSELAILQITSAFIKRITDLFHGGKYLILFSSLISALIMGIAFFCPTLTLLVHGNFCRKVNEFSRTGIVSRRDY